MTSTLSSTSPAARNGAAAVLARILGTMQEMVRDGVRILTFQAMGTRCSVSYSGPARAIQGLSRQIVEWVATFESRYSRFLPDSVISRINAAAGGEPVEIDAETEQILAVCDHMHFMTGGVFDASSLPLIQLWNWKKGVVPSEAEIQSALRLVGWRKVRRGGGRIQLPEPGMGIDLGGMGKEFAVDRVAQICAAAGVSGALIDFGSDVRTVGLPADGRPGWHIGLDDPRKPGSCWCGVGLRGDGAVATSGDYIRRFEAGGRRYGHILDVRTGRPVDNGNLAVSAIAPGCALAGLLSTTLFVLGPDAGMRLVESQPGAACAVITEAGVRSSRHFYDYVVS